MNWDNLKENKCPQCGKDFVGSSERYKNAAGDFIIKHNSCGFRINERKYSQIVSGQINRELKEKEDSYDVQ